MKQTEGLSIGGSKEAQLAETEKSNAKLSEQGSVEVKNAEPTEVAQWSDYDSK